MQFARVAVAAPRAAGLLGARWAWGLAAITLAGAILRWPTLAGGSFWYDEWLVHNIVYVPLHKLPEQISSQQTTPPLYYYVAWAWARVFSPGANSLRALSGAVGVATVPAAFAATAALATRRAALVVAALVAVNPLFVWYSVEARPYALVTFLAAVTLWLFALALRRPGWPVVLGWGAVCGLALATHYYAVFLVAAEAVFLLVALRHQRSLLLGLGAVVVAGLALAPLALDQLDATSWIEGIPLRGRLKEIVEGPLVGVSPFSLLLFWPLAALAVLGLGLAWRGSRRERRAATLALGLALLALAFAFVPLAFGADTLLLRNVIPLVLPFVVAVGIGLGSERHRLIGAAAAGAVCALSLALVVAIPLDRGLQRADWGAAARALPPQHGTRLVVTWSGYRAAPLFSYLRRTGDPRPPELRIHVDEVDVLALQVSSPSFACWSGAVCGEEQVTFPPRRNLAGLTLAGHRRVAGFDLYTYRSPRPVRVEIYPLYNGLAVQTGGHFPRIFVQHWPPAPGEPIA